MSDGLQLEGLPLHALSLDAFQREMLAALGHEMLVLAGGSADTGSARSGDARSGASQSVDLAGMPPLRQALLRAVGGDASRLAGLPPLDTLRTPAAKRALWPRLRALRRQSRP